MSNDLSIQYIEASLIREPLKLYRAVDSARVQQLAISIQAIGLLSPIIVAPKKCVFNGAYKDVYEILAGVHRFRAMFRNLDMEKIPVLIRTGDQLENELITIDENICRSELSQAELSVQMNRRKEIYEIIHPETKHGGNAKAAADARWGNASRKTCDSDNVLSFTADTAAKTGMSERKVQLIVERGREIYPSVMKQITGTHLDKPSYLDKIKAIKSEEEQQEMVIRDLQNKSAAKPSVSNSDDKIFNEIWATWKKLCKQLESAPSPVKARFKNKQSKGAHKDIIVA